MHQVHPPSTTATVGVFVSLESASPMCYIRGKKFWCFGHSNVWKTLWVAETPLLKRLKSFTMNVSHNTSFVWKVGAKVKLCFFTSDNGISISTAAGHQTSRLRVEIYTPEI